MKIKSEEKIFMNNLNLLKLIALILVVIGHCTNQYKGSWVFVSNQQSDIYRWVSIYVNSIHMQIFTFVSGSVYAYCKLRKNYYGNYISLVKDKFKRLIIPYVFIGVSFMIPIGMKVGISAYENGFINSIKNLILGYSAGHLWFLMMLFTLFLVYYWVEKILIKVDPFISIFTLFFIQVISGKFPSIFFIQKAMYYMLFFHLGHLVYLKLEKLVNIKIKLYEYRNIIIYSIFVIIPLLVLMKGKLPHIRIITMLTYSTIDNLIAVLGIIQMYLLVVTIKETRLYNIIESKLNYINKYNFNIYLLHEPIIFILLSNILNLNPTIVVISNFTLSICISIILAKLYYLIVFKLKELTSLNKGLNI